MTISFPKPPHYSDTNFAGTAWLGWFLSLVHWGMEIDLRAIWPVIKNTIPSGETCTVPSGYQMIVETQLNVDGTLSNSGEVYVEGEPPAETAATIKEKLGITTLSGSNTGDQTSVSGNAGTVTVAGAASDTTCWPLLGTSQTGNLSPATDAGLTYNATTGVLTSAGGMALGSSAPVLLTKKLTGTTASTEGGYSSVTHGLTASKILAVDIFVYYSATGAYIPPAWARDAGFYFDFIVGDTYIFVENHDTSSENILSAPFTILVTYEA